MMIFNVVEEDDKFKVTIEKFILKFPKDLFYSKDDMWVSKEDSIVVIGATDYFQTVLSDILFLEMESNVGDAIIILKKKSALLRALKQCLTLFHQLQEKLLKLMKDLKNRLKL